MNNSNQSSNFEPENQNQKTNPGFWKSLSYSIWGDPFSMLKSPLFIVMTLLIVAITFLLSHYTQNLEISILSGLILELLTAVVMWQFLSLSRRLEVILTQTSDLQYKVQNSENEFRESLSELDIDLSESQRLFDKIDDEMDRISNSDKEMKRAVTLFCENLVEFYNRIGDWRTQQNTDTQKITRSLGNVKGQITNNRNLLRKDVEESSQQTTSTINDILKTQIALASESQHNAIAHLFQIQASDFNERSIQGHKKLEVNLTDQMQNQFDQTNKSLLQVMPERTARMVNKVIETNTQRIEKLEVNLTDQMQNQFDQANKNLLQIMPEKTAHIVNRVIETNTQRIKKLEINLTEHMQDQLNQANKNLLQIMPEKTAHIIDRLIEASAQRIKKLEINLTDQMQDQLNQANKSLLQIMPEKTAHLVDDLTGVGSLRLLEVLALFEEQIELLNSIDFSVGETSTLKEPDGSEISTTRALEVSTALDRLNLELRRQLVEMRQALKQPNDSIQ